MPKKSAGFLSNFTLSDAVHLILAIFVSQLAGIIGALFTTSEIPTWYALLERPFFSPPNWLFGPVWTLLYTLMGIAAYLSCKYGKPAKQATIASYWFYAQLVFNTLWSIVFFGLHSLWGAVGMVIILWLLIFKTMTLFRKMNKWAGWLMLPYLAWVTFAALLNISIAILN
jgi:benzodiazapine receptor